MILPYWKLETFNDKLNVTIAFLKMYWRPLIKANMLIAGPLFIIGIGMIMFYSNIVINNLIADPDNPNVGIIVGFVFTILIGGIFYGLSIMSITMVTFEFIKTQKDRPEKLNDINYLFQNAKKRFGKMFGLMLIGVAANYLVSLVVNIFVIPVMFLGPFATLILVPAYLFGYVAVYTYMYIIAPTAYYEKISTSKTLKQGIGLVKNKFWQTAGMFAGAKLIQTIIVSGLIVPLLSVVFGVLFYRYQSGGEANVFNPENQQNLIYLAMFLSFIYLSLNLISNIFHIVTGAVQYYTLKEDKENPYIFHNIDHFEQLGLDD